MDVVTPEQQAEREATMARMTAPLTEQEIEAARVAYEACGVTAEMWSQLKEDSRRAASSQFRNYGKLMDTLVSDVPFNTTSPAVRVKDEIAPLYRSATMFHYSRVLVTDGEDWWPLPRVLLCDTHELLYVSCIYTAVKRTGNKDFVRYLPTGGSQRGRGPGRPKSEEVAQRRQAEAAYKGEYFAWQEECRAVREERAALEERLEGLRMQCRELQQQIHALRVPEMPRKPS